MLRIPGVFSISRRMASFQARPQKPLIAVIGATGTGKSQLAVELAAKFGGEIVNSDAIQLYEGLPIITNKIRPHEQKGIPHHLLGCIGLDESTWNAALFMQKALVVIDEIRSRGRLPILVGGSHFYVQALLFLDTLMDIKEDDKDSFPILQEPTETILEKLREVDPVMADRWHPKDRRKIQRSLEIWLRTGRPASEMYAEQHGDSLQSDMSDRSVLRPIIAQPPGLRYDTLIFWVYASKDVLRSRLDSRVLDMVKNGLMEEIESLESFQSSKNAVEETEKIDKTRGIWVAIGYKEFEQYRNALKTGDVGKETLNSLKQDAILRTQAATRQYANGQIRWIRYKFLNALARSNASNSTFLLDGSDISRWDIEVSQLALNVAGKFLSGENLPEPLVMSEASREMLVLKGDDISHSRGSWIRQTCENCDVTAVTAGDWEKHINSRRHRKVATAKSKRQSLRIEQRLKQQPTTDSFVSATSADNLAKEECEGEANLGNSTM